MKISNQQFAKDAGYKTVFRNKHEIKFGANLLPVLVNEDAVMVGYQIGKVQLRNTSIINNGCIRWSIVKIAKLKFDSVDIPEKLRGTLALHFDKGRHARDKSIMEIILRHDSAVGLGKIRSQPPQY